MIKRNFGYSLFEVLVAFAVMSVVLAALIPGQARLQSRALTIDERLLAQDFAFSRIAALGISEPLAVGEVRSSYNNWLVVQQIKEHTLAGTNISGYKVKVSIQDTTGKHIAQVETIKVKRNE